MGVLKVRVDDAWEVVGGDVSEMLVSDVDPYVISPTATEELWYSPVVRQLFARVNDRWEPAVINEVMVSRNDPAGINPEVELWYDVDATPSSPSTKPVAIDEVWVGDQEPYKPGVELWYDVAAVAKAMPGVPSAGEPNTALVKVSADDLDTRWGGQLDVPGSLNALAGLNMGANQKINFGNQTGPKINLYSTTFGIGVEAGTTTIWSSGTISFHQNASNGTRWAFIDGTCGNGRVITEVNGDARYAKTVQGRSNSGFLSLPARNLTGSYASIYTTPISYPSGNRRIKVTVQLKVNPGGECHIFIKCFGQETAWTLHAVMPDTIGPAVFIANASGTSQAIDVQVKSDIGSGNILADASSWVLVEDLGPR